MDRDIFATGPVTVPVFFQDIEIPKDSFFNVAQASELGSIGIRGYNQKINFLFKLYTRRDGPNVATEMISSFNHFIDGHRERSFQIDNSLFTCIDKVLFDLGYVGKVVKAEGIEKHENGNTMIYSINYAENLITKDDYEYKQYHWSKIIPNP